MMIDDKRERTDERYQQQQQQQQRMATITKTTHLTMKIYDVI